MFILLLLIGTPYAVYGTCPSGWSVFEGSCYLFHTDDRYTWLDATKMCGTHQDAHLAYIDSAAEDLFIGAALKSRIDTSSGHDTDGAAWIGGTDEVIEGLWQWYGLDEPIPLTGSSQYSNWWPGEPDHGDDEKEEDCLCLVGNKQFKWQDHQCSERMFYVCERPSSEGNPGFIVGK